jgi:hypothetical protein
MIPVFSRGFPPSRPILIDRLGDMDVKLVIILTGLLRTNAAFAIARGQQQRPGRLRGMDKGGEVLPRGLDAPVSRGNDSLGSGLGWWNTTIGRVALVLTISGVLHYDQQSATCPRSPSLHRDRSTLSDRSWSAPSKAAPGDSMAS